MSVSECVANYLRSHDIEFEVVKHPPSRYSAQTAHEAHVPGARLAKAVVMEDGERFVVVVIPATHRIDPVALRQTLRRDAWFVPEEDLGLLFRDCRPGAVPPLGAAYGLETVLDDDLTEPPEVYFEAGDHEHLIHLDHTAFLRAFDSAQRGRISYHA